MVVVAAVAWRYSKYPPSPFGADSALGRDPEMPEWSPSTIARLRSSVFQILEQAGYVECTRTLKLQTVHIAREVLEYLEERDERYVLRCIQVAP